MRRVSGDNIKMTSNKGDNFISFPGILDDYIASSLNKSDSLNKFIKYQNKIQIQPQFREVLR
jgi:hypothetical protein